MNARRKQERGSAGLKFVPLLFTWKLWALSISEKSLMESAQKWNGQFVNVARHFKGRDLQNLLNCIIREMHVSAILKKF